MKKEFLVGLVFLSAIALAGIGTIAVSGSMLFKETKPWTVTIDNVGGLQAGDDVRVLGLKMGTVRRIDFDKNRNLFHLKLRMDTEAPIHEGYKITVRETSALGGTYLAVEPGAPEKPLANVDDLKGQTPVVGGISGSINEVATEVKQTFATINKGEGSLGKLINDPALYDNLKQTSESLREIMGRINSGQGTLGHFVNDDAVYNHLRDLLDKLNTGNNALARLLRDDSGVIVDDLKGFAANVNSITGKIDQGQGLLGRLINDPKMANDAATVIADIRNSRGIFGWLINDEKARDDAAKTLSNLSSITTTMEQGHGTIGQLLTKDEVYQNILSSSQHLNNALAKVDNGTGTLGKLVNDPSLYDNAKRLVTRATDAIENARDSAPVSAITSFILGPFQ